MSLYFQNKILIFCNVVWLECIIVATFSSSILKIQQSFFFPSSDCPTCSKLEKCKSHKCFVKIEQSFELSNKTWDSAWQRVSFCKVYTFLRNWCQNFKTWLKVWMKDHLVNKECTKCLLWKDLDPWLDFWRNVKNTRRPHCSFRERWVASFCDYKNVRLQVF